LLRFPVDEREIHAVVFEMASHAVLAVRIAHSEPRVIPMIRCKPLRNLFVTVEAFECRCARSELMTACALGRARQRLMRFGEWPR
jgi:hypothetical protein